LLGLAVLFICLYAALLVATLAMPLPHPSEPGQVFMKSFLLVLWGLMAVGSLHILRTALSTITVDATGITKEAIGSSVRIGWNEVVSIDTTSTGSRSAVLRTSDGRKIDIPYQHLNDGQELRHLVEERTTAALAQAGRMASVQEFRMRSGALSWAIFAMLAVFLGGSVIAVGSRQGWDEAAPAIWMVALILLPFAGMAAYGSTLRVRLTADSISKRSLFGGAEIPFQAVRKIRLFHQANRGGAFEFMEIHAGTSKQSFSPMLADYSMLRDQVLKSCPQAKVLDERPGEVNAWR
jgi:hypothetical protein